MNIFLDGIPLGELPAYERQPGEFFPRLVGVKVSSDGNLEPLYIPALRFHRRAGQILIEVNGSRPLAYITLQAKPPYLYVFYFPWHLWDREEL